MLTSFEAGPPVVLFQTHLRQPISAQNVFSYDVTGDGQKFLINPKVDEPNAAPLSVILNWASEMEKLRRVARLLIVTASTPLPLSC